MKELTLRGNIRVFKISGLHESIASLFNNLPRNSTMIGLENRLSEEVRNDGLIHDFSGTAIVSVESDCTVIGSKIMRAYKWITFLLAAIVFQKLQQTKKCDIKKIAKKFLSYPDLCCFRSLLSRLIRLRCHFHLIWRFFFHRRELLFIEKRI